MVQHRSLRQVEDHSVPFGDVGEDVVDPHLEGAAVYPVILPQAAAGYGNGLTVDGAVAEEGGAEPHLVGGGVEAFLIQGVVHDVVPRDGKEHVHGGHIHGDVVQRDADAAVGDGLAHLRVVGGQFRLGAVVGTPGRVQVFGDLALVGGAGEEPDVPAQHLHQGRPHGGRGAAQGADHGGCNAEGGRPAADVADFRFLAGSRRGGGIGRVHAVHDGPGQAVQLPGGKGLFGNVQGVQFVQKIMILTHVRVLLSVPVPGAGVPARGTAGC